MRTDTTILIVGTGFSGLGMAIRLKKAGIQDFVVVERAARIGGTWRDNRYPGVACDVPAHLYSYSFEPNPHWSRMFAPQSEILAYLEHCADKYGVRSHIHFSTEVVSAKFDPISGLWTATTSGGHTYRARALICGGGVLSKPTFPDIPGVDRFKGKAFHTARWDHDYALEGKRVAVIGTGASAVQVVPAIVDRVAHLALFQRTPPWILPRPDFSFGHKAQQRWQRFPLLQRAFRSGIYWAMESGALGFTGSSAWFQRRTEAQAHAHLKRQVKDAQLRQLLTPNYRAGCKRILLSNDYYPALQRPNAALVTEGIEQIREHSIVTRDGQEYPVDAIVYATGFYAAEGTVPFHVTGRYAQDLEAEWRDGPEAYLGTTVSGYPNMFILLGPNVSLGHNSMVFMIESQIQYVLEAVQKLRERRLAWVDVRPGVQARFNQRLQRRMHQTVWSKGGCISWYKTKTGKNTTIWPGYSFEFWARTASFDLENYETAPEPRALLPRGEHETVLDMLKASLTEGQVSELKPRVVPVSS